MMSGTNSTFTAPRPSIETAAAMSEPESAREPRTMANPSPSERRRFWRAGAVGSFWMRPKDDGMREMNANETRNVAASVAKPAKLDPNVPNSRPAIPAPITEPMTWDPCASEFAAGSPSAGTIFGSSSPRAGRKNVETLDCAKART